MGEENGFEPVIAITPALVAKQPRRRPSARAFEIFRACVVQRETETAVAKRYGISQPRVSFLVKRVTTWAREHQGIGDVLAIKVQQTARLNELYREAREQWHRSCQDEKSHSIVTVEGQAVAYQGHAIPLPDKKTTRVQMRGQSGNPALLRELRGIEADIRGIWGADAPKQTEVDEHREIVIRVVQDDEWYSSPHLALAAPAGPSGSNSGVTGEV